MAKYRVPLEVLDGLPENITSPTVPISERLNESGVYPHFEGTEIETKLKILQQENSGEQILGVLQRQLEQNGYTFISPQIDTRENYVVYYSAKNGVKNKIIAKNRGESGFQVKSKIKDLEASSKEILIKKERKSERFNSFAEAEAYLASELGADSAQDNIRSIIRVRKYKLTLGAKGDDSVTRFFRLIVDESEIPQGDEHGVQEKLRQIELEYKGSDRKENDDLNRIKVQMEKIIDVIMLEPTLSLKRTDRSKRKWSAKRSKPTR